MQALTRGRYVARLARSADDLEAAQRLRHLAFHAARGRAVADGRDSDNFDEQARHMLILDPAGRGPVACYRLQCFRGAGVADSYSAQFYDLSRLSVFPGPMMELGRFCLHPEVHDPDVLRLAWAAMTRLVDAEGIALLFGCSSFAGADPAVHAVALSSLGTRAAPDQWRPGARASDRVSLGQQPMSPIALAGVPPLLRTYLSMGGWVSDHAVIDRAMDTLHVFTGVEIAAIPAARAQALRLIAGQSVG